MGRPILAGTIIAALLLVPLACADKKTKSSAERVFRFTPYRSTRNVEATKLEPIDPTTLRRIPGPQIKLGDWAGTESYIWGDRAGILGPDRKTLVLGGGNFGAISFVDLDHLRRVGTIRLIPRGRRSVQIGSWPRADRLIATTGEPTEQYQEAPHELFFVNPKTRRVLQRRNLRGTIEGVGRPPSGDLVLLLAPNERVGRARLVVASPNLRLRSVRLGRIRAGTTKRANYRPLLVLDEAGRRALVVDASGPIAEIALPSLRVQYHRIPSLPRSRHTPRLAVAWQTAWRGDSLFAGVDNNEKRVVRLIDTNSWSIRKTIREPNSCRALGDVFLCDAVLAGRHTLAAYGFDGQKRWERQLSADFWDVRIGRLFVGAPDIVELDPRTGGKVRDLGRMTLWNAEVRSWLPPA